nr:unnamed protein product [Callosobruchus chinensis]
MRVIVRKLINFQHEDYDVHVSDNASVLDLRTWFHIVSGDETCCQDLFYGGKQVMHDFSFICFLYRVRYYVSVFTHSALFI